MARESILKEPKLTKRGKVWYARYYSKNGQRQWLSLKTSLRETAERKISELRKNLARGDIGYQFNPKPLGDYLREYLSYCEVEHSARTYRLEKQVLSEFVEYTKVNNISLITKEIIERYKVRRAKEVSASTVNRVMAVIKAFLNRAVQLDYIEKNPAQYVKRLKEKQRQIEFLSDEEVRKLLEVSSPRMRQIITVFLLTGMRLGELAHLRWKDVDFRHNLIHIQNQKDWTTKSFKPRSVPMHETVTKILSGLSKGKADELIFPTNTGKSIESYIRSEVLRYAKKAGVRANIKMFRSTFASNLVMSGVDIYAVSKLLGHHDVKITEKHYAHLTPDFLRQSVDKLDFSSKRRLPKSAE